MFLMPERTTVWMVHLNRERVNEDVRGSLSLDEDALVFIEAVSTIEHRFPLEQMQSPKRVRGSPIMIVFHQRGDELRRTAFYFSQPPPLRPPDPGAMSLPDAGLTGRPAGPFGALRRSSKRRHMRTNLTYLTTANSGYKPLIKRWVAEIDERIGTRG
jgi:hypothetical protein